MARSINEKVNSHLQAALDSLERERAGIDDQIRAIRLVLGQAATAKASATVSPAAPGAAPTRRSRKRKLSAEARARIAAAQKKRWAEFRKKKSGSDS
ncbi:MAG: hypothetical protein FJW31_00140 [Acidobacteria bacterium]|nr:hypothetical protein [Acidobacteriota bacterium]